MKKIMTKRSIAAACLAILLIQQLPVYAGQPKTENSASEPCSPEQQKAGQTARTEPPLPQNLTDKIPLIRLTPELLTEIDGIVDETVGEALAAQRQSFETDLRLERQRYTKERLRLEHSRNFWRTAALVCCAAVAAETGGGLLLYTLR
jgi:hypothetical protein